MTHDNVDNPDERFYFEIWTGESDALKAAEPSISYCENHNADFDYGLAALDFKIAAEALINHQRNDPHMGNWTAPILYMIRQTLELTLKSLIETIEWKGAAEKNTVKFVHNLEKLWAQGRTWLIKNGYSIETDARLATTDKLIENMHAIDPTGDLFRFGTSRKEAFGRSKSSDRVGYKQGQLFDEFEQACACLDHWCGVIMREVDLAEEGWEDDPLFDRDNFPKTKSMT